MKLLSLDDQGNGVGLYLARADDDELKPMGGAPIAMPAGDSPFGFTGAALSFVHTLFPTQLGIAAVDHGDGVLISAITSLGTRTSTPDAAVSDVPIVILALATRDGFTRVVPNDVFWDVISRDPLVGFGDRPRGDTGEYDLVAAAIDADTLETTDLFALTAGSIPTYLEGHRDENGFVVVGETREAWIVPDIPPLTGPFVVVRTDLAGTGLWAYLITTGDDVSSLITTAVVNGRAIISGRTPATITKPDGSESVTITPDVDQSWILAIDLASGALSEATLIPRLVTVQNVGDHLIGRRVASLELGSSLDPSAVLLDASFEETPLLSLSGTGVLTITGVGPGSLLFAADSLLDDGVTLASGRVVQHAALQVAVP